MTDSETTEGAVFQWAGVFYLLLAVAGVVWLGVRHGAIGLELFVDPAAWPLDLVLGVGVGAGLSGSWELARRALPQPGVIERKFRQILGPMTASEALVLALLSALSEEVFFRGAVQETFGWIPAAALFTLLHFGPGREFRLWTLFAALAGVALGGLVLWRGALLAPVVAHATVNGIGLYRLSTAEGEASERVDD